jgi:outer membrane protein
MAYPMWTRARALALALALSALATTAAAETKVAVVDTQRAVMETEDGLRAQASVKKFFDSRQRDLDKRQNDLRKEKEDIEKQRGVLSKASLQNRVEKWQRQAVELQTAYVDYNKELQNKQYEMTQPILEKALAIISRLARQEGFDVVVDKQAVPYVRTDLDLTDRVITLYNQGSASEKPANTGKATPPGTLPGRSKAPPAPAGASPAAVPKKP